MHWLNTIRLAPKLIGGFAVMALLAAVVGVAGLAGTSAMQNKMNAVTGATVPNLLRLLAVRNDIDTAVSATRVMVLTQDATLRAQTSARARAARADAWAQFQAYQASITNPASPDARSAQQTGATLRRWLPLNARIQQRTMPAGDGAAGSYLTLQVEWPLVDTLARHLTTLARLLSAQIHERTVETGAAHSSAVNALLAVMALAILLTMTLGFFITRDLTRPLAEVQQAARSMAGVASETAAASERLQSGAERVGSAMESIAAVSEQSAAGAEEVSASTEQQSASVQEMAAGAQELAALAASLQEAVARSTLETSSAAAPERSTAIYTPPPPGALDRRVPPGSNRPARHTLGERRRGRQTTAQAGVIPRRRAEDWDAKRA